MKIRKAILTGGGRATRLHPITTTINKHLLPLANKPMIFHAIEKVIAAGVTDIYININPGETELQKYIGDGGHWGVNITFFEQTGGPQGIAHVVNEARSFIGDEPFLFYLSDNILLGSLNEMVDSFNAGKYHCMLALSEVSDPQRFGVPVFDEQKKLIDVWEKPENPPNNFAVTGIYLYGPRVFFSTFDKIGKSPRGEYEISDIHSQFLKDGRSVGYKEITGWWKDTGKPHDLLVANKLLLEMVKESHIPESVTIPSTSSVSGAVQIGRGTRIGEHVQITGPVIIAENCVIDNCQIGPYVTIGQGSDIRHTKISNTIILDNCIIDCDIPIDDSLLGRQVVFRRRKEQPDGHRMIIGDKTIIEI